MAKDKVKAPLDGSDKPKKKKSKDTKKYRVKEAHIRRAKDGSYIIRHDLNNTEPDETSEEMTAPDLQGVHDHIDRHLEAPSTESSGAAGALS